MSDRLEGKEVDMRLMYTGAALASVLFCTILYIRYEIDQQGKKIRPPQPNSDNEIKSRAQSNLSCNFSITKTYTSLYIILSPEEIYEGHHWTKLIF